MLFKDRGLFRIKVKDIGLFIGTGIFSIVFFNYCYFRTIEESGISIAALLLYTAPAIVMILSLIIFHEKINIKKIISLILLCLGLIFVTGVLTSNDRISINAIMLGLGSGLGYALYSIFGKLLSDKYNSYTITLYTFIFASAGIIPFINIKNLALKIAEPKSLLNIFFISFLCSVVPFMLYTKALEKIETGKASIIATIEPLVATIVGICIFDEGITTSKVAGIVFILSAIVILNLKVSMKIKLYDKYSESR